ncbi:hypothetical protein TWF281_009585 [Arthrobotrys megalospora]
MSQPSCNRAEPISQEVWESHKHRIIQLWTDPDSTLPKLMKTIEAETGFVATERQYYRQLGDVWKIRKNFTNDDLEYISSVTRERKAMGKLKTRVKRNGVSIPEAKIKRKQSRVYVKTIDLKRRQLAAKNGVNDDSSVRTRDFVVGTPTEVDECSPAPLLRSPEYMDIDTLDDDTCKSKRLVDVISSSDEPKNYHAYVDDTPDSSGQGRPMDAYKEKTETTIFPDPSDDARGGRGGIDEIVHEPDGTDAELQRLVLDGLQQLSLDGIIGDFSSQDYESRLSEFQTGPPIDRTRSAPEAAATSWRAYAHQHEQDFQDFIRFKRQEAAGMILLASLATSPGSPVTEEVVDSLWLQIENESGWEPLPIQIYEQIVEGIDQPIGDSSGLDDDEGVSGFMEENFLKMKSVNDNLRFEYCKSSIIGLAPAGPAGAISCLHRFNSFDSVVVHLPRIISEFGMDHFFTAFAFHEASQYMSDPRKLIETLLVGRALSRYRSLGMPDHAITFDCWEVMSRSRVFISDPYTTNFILEEVCQIYKSSSRKYGCQHPRSISVSSRIISLLLRRFQHSLHFKGSGFDYNSIKEQSDQLIEYFEHLAPFSRGTKRQWRYVVQANMLEMVQTCEDIGNFEGAFRLLKRLDIWGFEEKGFLFEGFYNIFRGRLYGRLGKYKISLDILFPTAAKAQHYNDPESAKLAFYEIVVVTSKRGPVLYKCLQPSLLQLLDNWERSGRPHDHRSKRVLIEAFSHNRDEYASALALRSLNQVSASDLQSHMFFQSLEDWVHIHGVSKADEGRIWDACDIEFM